MTGRLAAIDIGTNTVRLLIAVPRPDGGLGRLTDESATVRLGLGVDSSGHLAVDRMEAAATAVASFAARARADGAAEPVVLATSAVRDAANQADLLALVRARAGLAVEIIDGEREAELTFRGALLGRPTSGWRLVADIGGGSTEVITARDGEIISAISLQLGSGRLTERCLPSDPPTADEIAAARALADSLLTSLPATAASEAVLVGGTASALLRLTPRPAGDDQATQAHLDELLARLRARPAADFAAETGIDAARARVMPGGLVIIAALLDRFQLNRASISQGGIREGVLLERLTGA